MISTAKIHVNNDIRVHPHTTGEMQVNHHFKDQQYGICQWSLTDSPEKSGWRANEPIGMSVGQKVSALLGNNDLRS